MIRLELRRCSGPVCGRAGAALHLAGYIVRDASRHAPGQRSQSNSARRMFPSVTSCNDAMRDDVDEALVHAEWRIAHLSRTARPTRPSFALSSKRFWTRSGRVRTYSSGVGPASQRLQWPYARRSWTAMLSGRSGPRSYSGMAPKISRLACSTATQAIFHGQEVSRQRLVMFPSSFLVRGVHVFTWRPVTLLCPVLTQ